MKKLRVDSCLPREMTLRLSHRGLFVANYFAVAMVFFAAAKTAENWIEGELKKLLPV